MAESKGALIARSVQKHAGRAKEKLLQNLGKVDRTADEIFDEHLQNFNRQQQQAARLQKEFNNYIRCIRATQTASKSLMEAITEVYESGWSGHDLTYVQAQNMEMLWQDFSHKLGDQVLIPLNTYTQQFPEMRKKIDKRGRKLVDYDSQRHNFQAIQANSSKRRDDVKLTRGRELLEEAKRTYETLNTELHDELPALYDSRILFLVSNLQTLFTAEHVFHNETSKVYAELEAITDKLASESQRGSYTIKKTMSLSNNISPLSSPNTNTLKSQNGTATPNTGTIQLTPPALNGSASEAEKAKNDLDKTQADHDNSVAELDKSKIEPDKPKAELNRSTIDIEKAKSEFDKKIESEKSIIKSESTEADELGVSKDEKFESAVHDSMVSPSAPARGSQDSNQENNHHDRNDKDKGEDLYDIPVGATLSNLPAGVLYRVRATYRYTREDADELSFDVGEVIRVVEYDDPEEQEEGWLMGIKESTNEKGMFPANFTRPI